MTSWEAENLARQQREAEAEANRTVRVLYVNYRNEEAWRRIIPRRFRYGTHPTQHTTPCWMLEVWDLDKGALRMFAMRNIKAWEETEPTTTGGGRPIRPWTRKGVKRMSDAVNPAHYKAGGIEVMDALEAWGLHESFCLGNVVKYIARSGKKAGADPVQDLEKAAWYLQREITRRKKTNG